jgi:hypothetical protein
MKKLLSTGLALLLVFGAYYQSAPAQQASKMCVTIEDRSVLKILPDKVPLEAETIAVETRSFSALKFPDGNRVVIAPLITSGYGQDLQAKYQFILVSESRLVIEGNQIPSGLIGIGIKPEENREAPTRQLVARGFNGELLAAITLTLDTSGPARPVKLTPKGEKEFELRFGRYVVVAKQR